MRVLREQLVLWPDGRVICARCGLRARCGLPPPLRRAPATHPGRPHPAPSGLNPSERTLPVRPVFVGPHSWIQTEI